MPNPGFRIFAATMFFFAVNAWSSPDGVVEGQVTMLPKPGANLADAASTKEKVPYAKSPVVVLSKDGQNEIKQATLDKEGRFRINLAPGDYLLDLKRSGPNRALVTKRPFTVVAGGTVRVDIEVENAIEAP